MMAAQKTTLVDRAVVAEGLLCLALFAIFLPVKVYPLVFILAMLVFAWDTPRLLRHAWVWCLVVFTAYASLIFGIGMPENAREITNFLKVPINFGFCYFAVGWMAARNNSRLLRWVDVTLHVVLALTLVQLLAYHQAAGFRWLGGAPSSAHGSALYADSLYCWGLDDKNMFGARIALLGFVYVLLPVARQDAVIWWRIVFVLLLAWLSLSRTPMVALLLGFFCLLWAVANVRWRLVLGSLALLALPVVAQKVVRIDSILASNDGMGVRLVYWKSFFKHFETIAPWGNGFMSGREFLGQYADFYHGEPHIHNTFFSAYLDFGVVGLCSYVLFLAYFYQFCLATKPHRVFWLVALLPLMAIMMILYSGYDNDIVVYLVLLFLLGSGRAINFQQVKGRIV